MGAGPRVAIVGGGMSGLCMGIALRQAGLEDFVIYEKGANVGGTWWENTYPGVACDVPSHLYSYSFEPNPEWSHVYAPGGEIQHYFERCAGKYGLWPHIRVGREITEARFDEAASRWRLTTGAGEHDDADVLVSAIGALHVPNYPDIEGLDGFAGAVIHSAAWNQDADLSGKRVAVIGSAASAVQIVPSIVDRVAHLDLFQRTPNWIIPRLDRAYPASWKRAFRSVPFLGRLHRWQLYWMLESRWPLFLGRNRRNAQEKRLALRHLEAQVPDPDLRAKLTPDYPPGCKRILVSDDFYPALAREHVDLVTDPIARIAPDGVVTADGALHRADVIILATGFRTTDVPRTEIAGRDGLTLREAWQDGMAAHRTVAVPGFPNFFMLLGPGSGLGHSSIIFMVEQQVRYVLQCIWKLVERRTIEPRPEAAAHFDAAMQRGLAGTIWQAGCNSWYQDQNGKITTLWPHSTLRYWWEMRKVRFGEYTLK
ncbi:NAD(P)/FAD-dependent oxidoreductase [Emcibacter sp. SYSU 3D8]|uniref:flavin-containing monooxygenase n=1 Tax=Emcibacter sp. SYSU 3D8 TaxID=3133969 RepID=UPI0031FF2A2B